jgi:hypothetical protein
MWRFEPARSPQVVTTMKLFNFAAIVNDAVERTSLQRVADHLLVATKTVERWSVGIHVPSIRIRQGVVEALKRL